MFLRPNGGLLTPTMAQSLGYWNGLRGQEQAPTLLRLDPFFATSMMDRSVAADVSGQLETYSIWAVGEKLRPYLTRLQPGSDFSEQMDTPSDNPIWQTYLTVKTTATPHLAAFDYEGPAPGIASTIELFLPFRVPEEDDIGDVVAVIEFSPSPVPMDLLGPSQCQPLTPACRQARSGL